MPARVQPPDSLVTGEMPASLLFHRQLRSRGYSGNRSASGFVGWQSPTYAFEMHAVPGSRRQLTFANRRLKLSRLQLQKVNGLAKPS